MNQTTKHGSGSAALGPASGFAFVSGRLLAPENDGGAAGGASGGGTTTTAPTTTPSQAATTTQGESGTAPGGGSEKMLPQSQVNALIASARREGREAAQRELQQQVTTGALSTPKQTAAPKSESDRLAALEAELAETKQRSVFDKHAVRLGVPDDLAEDLFALSKVQRPDNVGEWLEGKAARFGTKPAPTTPNQAAPVEQPKPPATAPSAPTKVDPLTSGGLIDIWNLSDQQLNQLGPSGVRAAYEQALKIGQQQQGAPTRPRVPGR